MRALSPGSDGTDMSTTLLVLVRRIVEVKTFAFSKQRNVRQTLEHDLEKRKPVFPRDKREAFARRSCRFNLIGSRFRRSAPECGCCRREKPEWARREHRSLPRRHPNG